MYLNSLNSLSFLDRKSSNKHKQPSLLPTEFFLYFETPVNAPYPLPLILSPLTVVVRWLEVLASYAGRPNLTVSTSGIVLELLGAW